MKRSLMLAWVLAATVGGGCYQPPNLCDIRCVAGASNGCPGNQACNAFGNCGAPGECGATPDASDVDIDATPDAYNAALIPMDCTDDNIDGPFYEVGFSSAGALMPNFLQVNRTVPSGNLLFQALGGSCPLENGLGVALFPLTDANGTVQTDSATAARTNGPAWCTREVTWTRPVDVCEGPFIEASGRSIFTFYPDGRISRWDELNHDALTRPSNVECDTTCPQWENFPIYLTSHLALNASLFASVQRSDDGEPTSLAEITHPVNQVFAGPSNSGVICATSLGKQAAASTVTLATDEPEQSLDLDMSWGVVTRFVDVTPSLSMSVRWTDGDESVPATAGTPRTLRSVLRVGDEPCAEVLLRGVADRSPAVINGATFNRQHSWYEVTSIAATLQPTSNVPAGTAFRFPAPIASVNVYIGPTQLVEGDHFLQQTDENGAVIGIWLAVELASDQLSFQVD